MSKIKQLICSGEFSGRYRATSCRQLHTRSGKAYMRMQLTDATGSILAYAWNGQYDGPWAFGELAIIEVKGKIRNFNGQWVADLNLATVTTSSDINAIALLPACQCAEPALLGDLVLVADSIAAMPLREFINDVFSDMDISIPFLNAPASLKHHHSEAGGLLRHSVECATIAANLPMLPQLHKDLAIVASLLHDIGKTRTFRNMKRTDSGYLVDHQALTLEVCAKQFLELDNNWPDISMALRHILTCRTIKRWGYEPRMAVAHAVQLADKLSVEMDIERRSFASVPAYRNVANKIVSGPGSYWRPSGDTYCVA